MSADVTSMAYSGSERTAGVRFVDSFINGHEDGGCSIDRQRCWCNLQSGTDKSAVDVLTIYRSVIAFLRRGVAGSGLEPGNRGSGPTEVG